MKVNLRTLAKYLDRSEVRELITCNGILTNDDIKAYNYFIVIPVLAELQELPEVLNSLAGNNALELLEQTLIVLVINNSKSCESDKIHENLELLKLLQQGKIPSIANCNLNLAWIDASTVGQEAPEKGGVGWARKVGCDSLLMLKMAGHESDKNTDWPELLIFLDADSPVAQGYLERIVHASKEQEFGAWSWNWHHRRTGEKRLDQAIDFYEKYLESYYQGLKYAQSPYAYRVMGSTLVCRMAAYVKAGGMRAIPGGEDFYFLQALAKVVRVLNCDEVLVFPAARCSDRVPFGTGPRLRQIIHEEWEAEYSYEYFELLKGILSRVEAATVSELEILPEILLAEMPDEVQGFFEQQKFQSTWRKIIANTPCDRAKRLKAFHDWFDAFRTMKFIHALREQSNAPEEQQ